MATVKQIAANAVGASPVSLYTWSAGVAELESLDVWNLQTTVVKVDLWLDQGGTSIYLVKAFAIDAGASLSYRGSIPLVASGDVIKIQSDTAASLDVLGRVTEF